MLTLEGELIENYNTLLYENIKEDEYFIRRIFKDENFKPGDYLLKFNILKNNGETLSKNIPVTFDRSFIFTSICATQNCSVLSGNIIQGVPSTVTVKSAGFPIENIRYKVVYKTDSNSQEKVIQFNYDNISPRNYHDQTFTFPDVPEEYQYYIAVIYVYSILQNETIETALPVRIIRPIEVINTVDAYIDEIYSPTPVSACIPGSIGSRVDYTETITVSKQNSVSITKTKSNSFSNSDNLSESTSESIGITETSTTTNTASTNTSENFSETESNSYNNTEQNNFNFSTTNGENWSWNFTEQESETNTEGTNSSNTIGANGSITTGIQGEGSIPLLGKASGKVETTLGASVQYQTGSSSQNSNSTSNSRGYITAQDESNTNQYGSATSVTESSSMSGTYGFSESNASAISESNGQTSSRVWDMSQTFSSGKIVTEGDSEAIGKTIVTSESISTSLSYSGFIPRGKFGMFFRQTTRFVKQSKIITYDINGVQSQTFDVNFYNWEWAPSLAISNTCNVQEMKPKFN